MVNWTEIHPDFTKELQQKWESKGFDQEQIQHWVQVFGDNFDPNNYEFFNWLVNGNSNEVIKFNQETNQEEKNNNQSKKRKTNWQEYGNPFSDFTEETTQQWIGAGFNRMQTREWLNIGLRAVDANYVWWLRDIEGETPESILNHGDSEALYRRYQEFLQSLRNSDNEEKDEGELLAEAINSSLEVEENIRWQKIHPDFTPELRKEWKDKWFTYEEVKEWVKGRGDIYDVEFASQLKQGKPKNGNIFDLIEIKPTKGRNAQKWLDKNFPKELRSGFVELDISGQDLEGVLKLEDFVNLKEINCHGNSITKLEVINCPKLKKIDCKWNKLVDPNFLSSLNPRKLTWLDVRDNAISPSDLSCFSRFTNLEFLSIGALCPITIDEGVFNLFYGSLEPLKNMSKLGYLLIDNTDINSGVEYLPNSLRYISYSTEARPESKIKEIKWQLDSFISDLRNNSLALVENDEPKIREINEEESKENNFSEQKEELNREIIQHQITKLQETINRLEKEMNILQKQLEKAKKSDNLQAVEQIEEKMEVKRKEVREFEERLEKANEQLNEITDSENKFSEQVEVSPKN